VNILVVSTRFPFPPRWGFATRVVELARQLSARHRVTLLSYAAPGDEDSESPDAGLTVEIVRRDLQTTVAKRRDQALSLVSRMPFECRAAYSREFQAAIDRLSAMTPFDLVQLESPLVADFRFPRAAQVVLDEHNIEYEVFERMVSQERSPLRRMFYRLEHTRFRRFEQRVWRAVDGCLVTSNREKAILALHAPATPVEVVPNGVDVNYFRPTSTEPHAGEIVFNGVLDYRPNLDGANFLAHEILPRIRRHRPDVHLRIVGRTGSIDIEPFRQAGAEVTGEVPDVRPHLERAAVVVVPIRMGGGTRLKVVEGLALARPMVSTTIGCEGVSVRDGEHLLIGDTADAFAAQVLRILERPALGDELGRAGRALMEREYSWDAAGARLEEFYERVVGGPRPHRRAADGALAANAGRHLE
jgi:polysaccharide biosynthesis protein PslH